MKRILIVFFVALYTSVVCLGQGYNTYLSQGQKLYNEGLYDDAITLFESARLKTDGDAAGLSVVNDWLSRARRAKSSYEKFSVPEDDVNFFSVGGLKEVPFSTGSPLTIVSNPSWCNVEIEDGNLKFTAQPNQEMEKRSGEVEVRMIIPKMSSKGKARQKNLTIHVNQDARVAQVRTVMFRTKVSGVSVSLPDDGFAGLSSQSFTLSEGNHRAVLTKPYYNKKEIEFTIAPDEPTGTKYVDVELDPLFALVHLNISSTDVKTITKETNPVLRIGKYTLDPMSVLNDEFLSSIEEDEIIYGHLYKGGFLPIQEGDYAVSVEADGFETFTGRFIAHEGAVVNYDIVMQPIQGTLKIVDAGGAEGAKIFVDRIEMGVVPATLQLPADMHTLVLEKDGYIASSKAYNVEVAPYEEGTLSVSMYPYSWVTFSSMPLGASVFVDNQVFSTPTPLFKLKKGEHKIEIRKDGYMPLMSTIQVERDTLAFTYDLLESHPLDIKSDEDHLYLTLIDKKTNIVMCDTIIPAKVNIPYGKYKVEMRRYRIRRYEYGRSAKWFQEVDGSSIKAATGVNDLAYKGMLRFTPNTKAVKRRTFSSNSYFNFLHGDYWMSSQVYPMDNHPEIVSNNLFSGDFIRFSPFTGYTTSLLKASMYEVVTPTGVYHPLAVTAFFLNGELRTGGPLVDWLDLSLLGTYAYLPRLDKILGTNGYDTMSGLDFFAGVELSTRLPGIDISFRIGQQFGNLLPSIPSIEIEGLNKNDDLPEFVTSGLVFGVSIGIGGKESKGQSIIRLWK